MKKIISIILIYLIAIHVVVANSEEKPVIHSAFGLSEQATYEEVKDAISNIFSIPEEDLDTSGYIQTDHRFFYDIPISSILFGSYKDNHGNDMKDICIYFSNDVITSDDLLHLYKQLCEEYGQPTHSEITRGMITLNGKKTKEVDLADTAEIQSAIDKCGLTGEIWWDNILFYFSSETTYSYLNTKVATGLKDCFIDIYLNEYTLEKFKAKWPPQN